MMKKIKCLFFSLLGLLFPVLSYADPAKFVPLTGDEGKNVFGMGLTMPNFINRLFVISIAVAAVLAVIMVAIGGFKYMTSESAFSLGSAKEQITNAIIGLIIVLAAVVILSTINPDIVSLRLFQP